jgi:EH_Signature domain
MIDQTLLNRLKASIEGMGLNRVQFGFPEMVIKEVQKAETLFKDFSKAKPSSQDAYKAALSLLRGDKLDDWAMDLVAAAVSIPIKEQRGRTVLESEYCDDLLRKYENDAYKGDLWRLTWYSLLNSYLTYDLARTTTEAGMAGFTKLRRLLSRTWPSIDKQSGQLAVPDWVRILRDESQLLSDSPVEKYARDYLAGNTDHIKALAENLGIPASSWFWQELVLGAVKHATQGNDEQFRSQILMLIELVKSAPVYRDKAIAEILNRYYKCSSRTVHPELRDFVIHASVWKNPKLKAAGIATAWNQVPEAVWRMVMGWVNERNLRDFFDILAARRHADHGRLKFWSRYMNQISWTRLVFGSETIWQKNHNAGIRALLESEEGTYATLQGATDKELDAFLMQIGEYIFVEFSKTGNGAYAYRASDLAFNLHADSYAGSTSDLKCGYYRNGRGVAKIIHTPGWEERTAIELGKLGIHPDRASARQEPARSRLSSEQAAALGKIGDLTQGAAQIASESLPADMYSKPRSAASSKEEQADEYTIPHAATSFRWPTPTSQASPSLSVDQVHKIVSKYQGAQVTEKGSGLTRRIWVTNPRGWAALENELKKMGFQWAASRQGWYWAED